MSTCTGPAPDGKRCRRTAVAHGLCLAHGRQKEAGKRLRPLRARADARDPARTCTARISPVCKGEVYAKGLCYSHWRAARRGQKLAPLREDGRRSSPARAPRKARA